MSYTRLDSYLPDANIRVRTPPGVLTLNLHFPQNKEPLIPETTFHTASEVAFPA